MTTQTDRPRRVNRRLLAAGIALMGVSACSFLVIQAAEEFEGGDRKEKTTTIRKYFGGAITCVDSVVEITNDSTSPWCYLAPAAGFAAGAACLLWALIPAFRRAGEPAPAGGGPPDATTGRKVVARPLSPAGRAMRRLVIVGVALVVASAVSMKVIHEAEEYDGTNRVESWRRAPARGGGAGTPTRVVVITHNTTPSDYAVPAAGLVAGVLCLLAACVVSIILRGRRQ
jgi:hypothetical protein